MTRPRPYLTILLVGWVLVFALSLIQTVRSWAIDSLGWDVEEEE